VQASPFEPQLAFAVPGRQLNPLQQPVVQIVGSQAATHS
jgi:hypothetical protein